MDGHSETASIADRLFYCWRHKQEELQQLNLSVSLSQAGQSSNNQKEKENLIVE